MSIPKINIKYLNGQLGTVAPSMDGFLAMAVIGATTVSSTFVYATPYTLYSEDSLKALGVTAVNNPRIVQLVGQFYAEASEGTPLVLVGYNESETMTAICDKSTGKLKALLQGMKGSLRGVVVVKKDNEEAVVTEGLDPDVFTAIPKAQELAEYVATSLYAPCFIALEGRDFSDAASLKDLSDEENNRVCVVIGDVAATSKDAAMGTFAGRIAASPIQQNIGRVATGALAPTEMYIGSSLVDVVPDEVATLYDKGYISPRIYVGRTGYYFADDRMACTITDDYAHLTARRTIDKAARIAYDTLLQYMLGEIPVNDDGTMQNAMLKSWQSEVEAAIDAQMTAFGELSAVDGSGCKCFIDPSQNVIATSAITMTLKVRPFAYARYITVELGFLVKK